MPDEGNDEKRERLARELAEHDRLMAKNTPPVAGDVPLETGVYTTQESRDRAAHTPAWVTKAQSEPDYLRFTPEELKQFEEQRRDMAERFPTKEARDAYERGYPPLAPPTDPEELAQYNDHLETYRKLQKEAPPNVTPEQQASLDKSLAKAELTDRISGASDVNSKPTPNDPTPLDKARDIGQDLHKSGVTMEK